MNSKLTAIAICTAVTVIGGGGYAVAATVVTGKTIKNGSITTKDVKKGTIKLDRLSKGTQALIRKAGTPGRNGNNGANGAPGANGGNGTSGTNGANAGAGLSQNWGTIFRNTIGSPDIDLAGGPNTATSTTPLGQGSLTMQVANGPATGNPDPDADKAAFGNEVDFAGDDVNDIDALGFQVFTTGENAAKGNPNMPNISIEIDPNLTAAGTDGFSTLTYTPPQSTSNQWSPYINATTTPASPSGVGFTLSGGEGTATGCTLANPCTFTQVQAALEDGDGNEAKIGSIAVGKGRDFAFQGAVDGLRVNDEVFDFEAGGTRTTLP